MRETWLWSLGREDPLGKGKAAHSGVLAWRILWTEEPGGLWVTGLQESDTTWRSLSFFPFHSELTFPSLPYLGGWFAGLSARMLRPRSAPRASDPHRSWVADTVALKLLEDFNCLWCYIQIPPRPSPLPASLPAWILSFSFLYYRKTKTPKLHFPPKSEQNSTKKRWKLSVTFCYHCLCPMHPPFLLVFLAHLSKLLPSKTPSMKVSSVNWILSGLCIPSASRRHFHYSTCQSKIQSSFTCLFIQLGWVCSSRGLRYSCLLFLVPSSMPSILGV